MEEGKKTRVLLVEDDKELLSLTTMQLKLRGYDVVCAENAAMVYDILENNQVDVILLDVMLPDADGHEVCEKIRSDAYKYDGPIIFMSCLGDSSNIVEAFREGGDDYLVKPAKIDEVIERIDVNLDKRKPQEKEKGKMWFRQFMIDDNSRSVYRVVDREKKDKIDLSPTEYNILLCMVSHQEEVLLYRELYKSVWDQEDLGDVRTLMVHVSNLRKKINVDGAEMIRAIRGVGYIFEDV